MISSPVPSALALTVLALVLVLIVASVLRPRLIADASGLHVRGVFGTRHLPWPAAQSELEIVSVLVPNRRSAEAVRYSPADGSPAVTIRALARESPDAGRPGRAEAELDDLWQWGAARGCIASAGAWTDGADGPGDPLCEDEAGEDERAPGAGASTGSGGADPRVPGHERLFFTNWTMSWFGTAVMGAVALVFTVGPVIHVLTADSRTTADQIGDVATLLTGLCIGYYVISASREPTVVDRDGFHVCSLTWRHLPWPASRSDLFVHITQLSNAAVGRVFLRLDDGGALPLPGLSAHSPEVSDLLPLADDLDEIWAWGEFHGAARDDGAHHPVASETLEDERVRSAALIDELRRRGA